MPLLSSTITWYWPLGSDALWLGVGLADSNGRLVPCLQLSHLSADCQEIAINSVHETSEYMTDQSTSTTVKQVLKAYTDSKSL